MKGIAHRGLMETPRRAAARIPEGPANKAKVESMRNARSRSALLLASSLFTPTAVAEIIYGITTSPDAPQTLVRFDSASPGAVTTIGPFNGLLPGQAVTAMDVRPATGVFYV